MSCFLSGSHWGNTCSISGSLLWDIWFLPSAIPPILLLVLGMPVCLCLPVYVVSFHCSIIALCFIFKEIMVKASSAGRSPLDCFRRKESSLNWPNKTDKLPLGPCTCHLQLGVQHCWRKFCQWLLVCTSPLKRALLSFSWKDTDGYLFHKNLCALKNWVQQVARCCSLEITARKIRKTLSVYSQYINVCGHSMFGLKCINMFFVSWLQLIGL